MSCENSHYTDVIMGTMASQITNLTIVYSTVCSGADQRKHQRSASLAFVRGIDRVTGEFPAQRASNAENFSIMSISYHYFSNINNHWSQSSDAYKCQELWNDLFRQWLWHQAITWTDIALLSIGQWKEKLQWNRDQIARKSLWNVSNIAVIYLVLNV